MWLGHLFVFVGSGFSYSHYSQRRLRPVSQLWEVSDHRSASWFDIWSPGVSFISAHIVEFLSSYLMLLPPSCLEGNIMFLPAGAQRHSAAEFYEFLHCRATKHKCDDDTFIKPIYSFFLYLVAQLVKDACFLNRLVLINSSHCGLSPPPAPWLSLRLTLTWAKLPRTYSAKAMVRMNKQLVSAWCSRINLLLSGLIEADYLGQ